jgi:hypothetical protein
VGSASSVTGQRADTIILVRIDPGKGVALLSLPRDLKVEIPGYGTNKINAAMRVETLVLVRNQQIQKARIDMLARRRQPPAPLRRRIRTQQVAVAVDHHRGEGKPLAFWRGAERSDPPRGGRQRHADRNRHDDEKELHLTSPA